MNLHFSAFIVVELLPNGRLEETARRRLSHVTQHKGNSILTRLKANETRSAVRDVLEKANVARTLSAGVSLVQGLSALRS